MCGVTLSVPQITQYNILPFFLLLQAFPHILWHRLLFKECQSVCISKQKKYLQCHSKGVQGMTLPLPSLFSASAIGGFRRYKDHNWAHLPMSSVLFIQHTPIQPGYSPLSSDPGSGREQVISLRFMVSARPWCLRLSRLSKVKASATGVALTGEKSSSCSTRHSNAVERCQGVYYGVQTSWKKIHICPHLIGFYLSSVWRSISIFLLVYLCHSVYDRNKWNLWKSEAKDNPGILA